MPIVSVDLKLWERIHFNAYRTILKYPVKLNHTACIFSMSEFLLIHHSKDWKTLHVHANIHNSKITIAMDFKLHGVIR